MGRDVTADAIKVGVTIIDFKALEKFNVKINRGDEQLVWEALIDDLNANGGAFGRTIEPTFVKYDLVQAASGEAACLKLWANLLIETGQLDDKRFTVIGGDEDEASIKEDLLAPLAEAGFEPEDVLYDNTSDGDLQAGLAAYDVYTEKLKSADVDMVLLVGASSNGATALLQRDYKRAIASENADVIGSIGQYAELPAEAYNGILSMVGIGSDAFDQPEIQKCVKVFQKAHPEFGKLKKPINVKEGEEDWGGAVVNAFNHLQLLVKVLEAAGSPTHEAIAEAVETKMESFSFGSVNFASFDPGKYDADDGFRLAVFDSTIGETGGLKPKGKLVDVTG